MKRKRGPKPDDRPGEPRHLVLKVTDEELDLIYELLPNNTRDRALRIIEALTANKSVVKAQ